MKTLFQPRQRGRFIHAMNFIEALNGTLVCYLLSCVWVALRKAEAGTSATEVSGQSQETFFKDLMASWERRDTLARGARLTLADGILCNLERRLVRLLRPTEREQPRKEVRITAENDQFDPTVLEGIISSEHF